MVLAVIGAEAVIINASIHGTDGKNLFHEVKVKVNVQVDEWERDTTLPVASCIATTPAEFSYVFWIPYLFSESILLALALLKGFKTYWNRPERCVPSDFPLMKLLLRDSILYFFV